MIARLGPGGVDLIPVKDHGDGLAAVESREADAYASDRAILIGLVMTSQNPARFALMSRYFSYEPYALMLRRGDPAFRLAVNRVLARLYRTGDIESVNRRWFGQMGVAFWSPCTRSKASQSFAHPAHAGRLLSERARGILRHPG